MNNSGRVYTGASLECIYCRCSRSQGQPPGNSPVLDCLRGCGGPQFGHQDSHNVEEENKVDL